MGYGTVSWFRLGHTLAPYRPQIIINHLYARTRTVFTGRFQAELFTLAERVCFRFVLRGDSSCRSVGTFMKKRKMVDVGEVAYEALTIHEEMTGVPRTRTARDAIMSYLKLTKNYGQEGGEKGSRRVQGD